MKKIKLKKIFAVAMCAAIAVLGCVFFKPQTNIRQAAADTTNTAGLYIDDISLFFSSDDVLKGRLKLGIKSDRMAALGSSSVDSSSGETVYRYTMNILIATSDSDIHGEDLKKMVVPSSDASSSSSSSGLIFQSENSNAYVNSNVSRFVELHYITLRRYNKGDGSTTFSTVSGADGYLLLNLDFKLPYLPSVLDDSSLQYLYNSDFTFYCVLSETCSYKIGNDNLVDSFYSEGTNNVLSFNVADEAKKMLKDDSATYTTEQLSVLKTVAGPISDESDSSNKSNGDSFKPLKKVIMAVCGIAIVAGVCVCVYSIVKRKKLSFIPARRKTSGDKVRRKKKIRK